MFRERGIDGWARFDKASSVLESMGFDRPLISLLAGMNLIGLCGKTGYSGQASSI
jgi:hypothetical protein